MHKVAVMAAAMIAALGGQPIGGRPAYVAPQPEESKKFHLDRAAAKRARRVVASNATAELPRRFLAPGQPVPPESKSRQVERAEFRREVKRGNHIRKMKDREKRAANRADSQVSLLRIAAMNAVSTLSGFGAKRKKAA